MGTDGLLCWNCRKVMPYSVKTRKRVREVDGKEYEYVEKYGECNNCHEEISVPGLDDENERLFDSLIRIDKEIITVDEINQLLKKYDIEKRPLSHVLGIGEHTISRYIEGALPNKKYSNLLRELLHDHRLMDYYLENNKSYITKVAYRKTRTALDKMIKLSSYATKSELIALYIIHRSLESTDMFLQKLLYYIKSFSMIVLEKDIVEDECEAWVYGPVFPHIYEKYKCFGGDIIPDYDATIDFSGLLSEEERALVDHVICCFGMYNGSALMQITHKEKPWKEARGGLPEFHPSNNVIDDNIIKNYFNEVNDKYNLSDVQGVKRYIDSLLVAPYR